MDKENIATLSLRTKILVTAHCYATLSFSIAIMSMDFLLMRNVAVLGASTLCFLSKRREPKETTTSLKVFFAILCYPILFYPI